MEDKTMNCLTVRPSNYGLSRHGLGRSIDSFFDDWFSYPTARAVSYSTDFSPRVNIRETEESLVLTFELPGMKKEEIKVAVKDDALTVSGEREFRSESDDDEYVRRELRSGSFSRSFTLPDTVDSDKVSADYRDGLLEITLAKREELKPKEIEVKVS